MTTRIEQTYTCPYCDTIHVLKRPAILNDQSVTATPIEKYEYSSLTDENREEKDGIALVCGVDDRIGTEREHPDGCGRQFYLNFITYKDGSRVKSGPWLEDEPRFDFQR